MFVTTINIDDDVQFEDIAYNGTTYIAVGNPVDSTSALRYVAISTDFESWIVKDIIEELSIEINEYDNYFTDIRYQGKYWYILITGLNKLIYSLNDGVNWHLMTIDDITSETPMQNEFITLGEKYSAILLRDSNSILYGNHECSKIHIMQSKNN
mgnify:CR=1 FL=1